MKKITYYKRGNDLVKQVQTDTDSKDSPKLIYLYCFELGRWRLPINMFEFKTAIEALTEGTRISEIKAEGHIKQHKMLLELKR